MNRAWKERYEGAFESEVQTETREDFNELNNALRVTEGRLDVRGEPAGSKRNWTQIAKEMAALFGRSCELYRAGDIPAVMASISGARTSQGEYQFSAIKRL